MSKFTDWAKDHKVAITAITTMVGILIWGLLPEEEQPVKEEWIPPKKKDWYRESDD